ncbi:CBF/Mak21 family-domain-containing protein [Xylariaceae sp. FL0804]|nr:CBF/Mak21 family-domain-containing protein [Xylariaceae sp. FL0804]
MPGPVDVGASRKRKREKPSAKASKRAKSSSSDDDGGLEDEILRLENEILESKKNYNNINPLLDLASKTDDADTAIFATVSLCRVFLRLLASGNMTRTNGQSDNEIVVVQWLKDRLGAYKRLIIAAMGRDSTASTGLTLAMRILKAESQSLGEKSEQTFPKFFLRDIVEVLIFKSPEDVRQEFCEKYLGEYADIRYHTFKTMKDILASDIARSAREEVFENAFDILAFFEDVPDSAEDLGELYVDPPKKKSNPVSSLTQQKRQAQEAWLALLNLEPTRQQRKQVLEIMTQSIAPWFTKPELLMDFLTDSYNAGGATSLLALSGVFYLIQERNLDYPSFYHKLYSLLDADILHSKHRSKFLRLLDTFLASTHLPAALVASFIKRITRLCLNAPPAAIVAIVPWVYNLFKRHPLCTFMIHRVPRTAEERAALESVGMDDPFLADEEDPMETRAIDSCLWETVQLQSHWHPNVATIAKIISSPFTKQQYNIEDFLDHSYSSLLEAEMAKPVRKPPVVEFMIPKRVLLPQDPASEAQDSLLVKMWELK